MDHRLSQICHDYKGDHDGDKIRIPCPVHDGKDKNCAVWIDDQDKIAAHCHSHSCDVTKYLWDLYQPKPTVGRISKEAKDKARWLHNTDAPTFEPPKTFKKTYQYTSQYQYWDKDHKPLNLVVVRYDDPQTRDKVTIPYIYAALEDGRSLWIARGPQQTVWYGLQTLANRDTVLIVEGEKAANAAYKIVGERMAVLSWQGGSGKYRDLDLSVLDDKEVILWPDYDEPGFKWAYKGDHNLYDKIENCKLIVWDGGEGSDVADVDSAQAVWDIIQTAGSADRLRLESVYSDCLIAADMSMTADMAKSIPCGIGEKCSNCHYKYIPAIAHPIDTLNKDSVMHDHAYIAQEESYVNLRTFRVYNKSQFDSWNAHLPGYSLSASQTASRQFQESSGTLKVNEREFRPGQPLMIDGKINVAKTLEWTTVDAEPTEWLQLAQHLFRPEELDHILNWLAFTIQRPEEKINHTLLVIGCQGAGKSLFFAPIEKALDQIGQHKTVDSASLQSGFTDYLENTKLLTMEELNLSGQGFYIANKLKPLQAAPPHYINVNPKFGKKYDIPNIVNIIAYSNYDLPVKLEENQRRWYVVKSTAERLEDQDWYSYARFNETLSTGYIDKILSYLSRRDLTSFQHTGNAPKSLYGREMEQMSISGMRELGPTIDEIDWPELTDLREVKDRLDYEIGRSKFINDNYLRKILIAKGWINLERCLKINNKSIRPWATTRGEMYKQLNTGDIVRIWKSRSTYSPNTHQILTNDDDG